MKLKSMKRKLIEGEAPMVGALNNNKSKSQKDSKVELATITMKQEKSKQTKSTKDSGRRLSFVSVKESANLMNSNLNNFKFDGIQVTVNSDDEDLDYVDDILKNDHDEINSIDLDNDQLQQHTEHEHINHDLRIQLNEARVTGSNQVGNKAQAVTVGTPVNRTTMDEGADDSCVTGLALGATSSSLTEEQLIMNNPHLKKLLNKMLNERIQDAKNNGEGSSSELLSRISPSTKKKNTKQPGTILVKLLSDTTIYVPALKQKIASPDQFIEINDTSTSHVLQGQNTQNLRKENELSAANVNNKVTDPKLIAKISDFVDQIWFEQEDLDEEATQEMGRRPKSSVNAPGLEEAQRRMEQAIVQTEKFKAAVEKPPGINFESIPFTIDMVGEKNQNYCESLFNQQMSDLRIVPPLD